MLMCLLLFHQCVKGCRKRDLGCCTLLQEHSLCSWRSWGGTEEAALLYRSPFSLLPFLPAACWILLSRPAFLHGVCVVWCPLNPPWPGPGQVRKSAMLLQPLCLVDTSHEPSHPSKHRAWQLGLSVSFRGSTWAGWVLQQTLRQLQLWKLSLFGCPRCRPVSSAWSRAALLTPLSILSVSLQPLLGKACL